jgi:peptide/nickel transport system permease protein
MSMVKQLIQQPKFVLAVGFIMILLTVSFLYEPLIANYVSKTDVMYEEGAEVIGKAPFSPLEVPPFGTDRYGVPLWVYIIQAPVQSGLITSFGLRYFSALVTYLFTTFRKTNNLGPRAFYSKVKINVFPICFYYICILK